jgi:hypothetical protein
VPGFSSNILVVLDISDPAHPKEAGRWWMPGIRERNAFDFGSQQGHYTRYEHLLVQVG